LKYSTLTSCISLAKTMAADAAEPITLDDIPFYECNLHCYTNALIYGDGAVMDAYMNVGDIVSFKNGNLREIFIQNKTAGNNGKISVVATVPTHFVKEALKL